MREGFYIFYISGTAFLLVAEGLFVELRLLGTEGAFLLKKAATGSKLLSSFYTNIIFFIDIQITIEQESIIIYLLWQSCLKLIITSMQEQAPNQPNFTLLYIDMQNDSPRRESINFTEFQISQVIGNNRMIDIRCQEERPFDQFLLRANELGYEANQITNQTIWLDENDSAKYQSNEQHFNFANMQEKEMGTAKKSQAKRQLFKTIVQLNDEVFKLQCQKESLKHDIEEISKVVSTQFKKYTYEWMQAILVWQQQIQKALHHQREEKKKLLQQNDGLYNRIYELELMNEHSNIKQNKCSSKLQDLQQEVHKLNAQINDAEAEAEQVKEQFHRMHEQKIRSYQQQIGKLNHLLEQSNQCIFDLEQKLASSNQDHADRQNRLKRQFEQQISYLKDKIERDYIAEFQKMKEELRAKTIEYQSYQQQLDQLKRQLQSQSELMDQQKKELQAKISLLQNDKVKLIKQNAIYQAKIQAMEVQLARSKPQEDKSKIEQLNAKLLSIQQKYRQKQAQLNYLRSFKIKQQSKLDPPFVQAGREGLFKESAISPSSGAAFHAYKPREQLINTILTRIKSRQQGANSSQLLDNSIESSQIKKMLPSTLRPISPQSILLEKEKDVRMRNISSKLEQLRSDIRRQIGMMKN